MGLYFGTYEVIEEIGRGGMATVYRARQASVDRDVAVKVIKGSIKDDSDAAQRFQREARVIARLEHPHILPIYDFDGTHEPPYIVMRYLDGGTLKDVMKQGLLPLSEVAYLIQQVASALDYAHRQGIVHRDIKPSNILIDREGNAFVSDLGIARITGGDGQRRGITMSGAIIGTPEYMSPEQAMGLADIDLKADIYSLGVMLFEMLTGHLPYVADTTMGILLKHIQSPIPNIRQQNAELPEGINTIIEQALAKEPDQRFVSAGELARSLLHLSGGTLTVSPVRLRAAAESLIIRPQKPQPNQTAEKSSDVSTGSRETPSEQQRQVTVVYVNAADFEEILMDTAPEDARATLTDLLNRTQRIIERGGGVVRERTATTLQALWGANEVHEDDPENAINTALAIRDTARRLTAPWLEADEIMPMQIGIDTGFVLIQSNPDGTSTTSGQPITLAARIERAAPPGSILISHDTFRHVIGIYTVLQETPVRVRGRSEPIEVYLVQEARPRAFRLQTRGVEGVETRMVGRDGELKLLQDALMLCIEDGETQMVTVTAEAGVGKSRLLFEFTRWIDVIEQDVRFFEGRATQQTTNLPYSLIRSVFSFRFEILDSDTPEVMREKFTQGITSFMGQNAEAEAAFIGQLVGFDFSEHPAVKPILSSADAFQRQALEHLHTFFRSITNDMPAIIELEDIHWADTHSLDLIDHLVSENRELPLMVICMARPELNERRRGWGEGQDFHHRIDLKPLSKLDTRRLVREVLQKVDDIPAEIRDLIVERADGNPFYIEELVKILLEDGVIIKGETEDANWRVLPERLSDLRVPPTLTGVLQARLDTLEPAARLLLGRASVVGRIFWVSAVEALEAADGFHIERQERILEDLRRREMIYLREKSDFAGTQEYVIKHAILRDVIYESLLKRQQKAYHAAAAEWLIATSAERADEYTGLIAEHYEKAGEMVKAAEYLLRASKQANAVFALDEALASANHGLEILPQEGDDAKQLRIYLQSILVEVYSFRWLVDQVILLGHETLALARELDHRPSIASLLSMLGLNLSRLGQLDKAREYLLEAETYLPNIEDPRITTLVLRQLGNSYSHKGAEIAISLNYFEKAIAVSRANNDLYGEASAYNGIGNINALQRRIPEALEAYEKSIAVARRIGGDGLISTALINISSNLYNEGDFEKALRVAHEALAYRQKIGGDPLTINAGLLLISIQMNASDDVIMGYLKTHLQGGIAMNSLIELRTSIEAFVHLFTREGHYERACELIGLWYASPVTDYEILVDFIYVNKSLETIRQHLSEDVIQAAIERGRSLDILTTAQVLLAELV